MSAFHDLSSEEPASYQELLEGEFGKIADLLREKNYFSNVEVKFTSEFETNLLEIQQILEENGKTLDIPTIAEAVAWDLKQPDGFPIEVEKVEFDASNPEKTTFKTFAKIRVITSDPPSGASGGFPETDTPATSDPPTGDGSGSTNYSLSYTDNTLTSK